MNEQEFGSAPIGKLFVRCTVPAMVGMGFSAIYSITDVLIVRRVQLQTSPSEARSEAQPPSTLPMASFFQPTLSFNYRRKARV